MITKAEAKTLVHKVAVHSLRKHKAQEIMKDSTYKDGDYKKLNAAMAELADFLEKRGKLNDQTDAGGEGRIIEAEVSSVREPKA